MAEFLVEYKTKWPGITDVETVNATSKRELLKKAQDASCRDRGNELETIITPEGVLVWKHDLRGHWYPVAKSLLRR